MRRIGARRLPAASIAQCRALRRRRRLPGASGGEAGTRGEGNPGAAARVPDRRAGFFPAAGNACLRAAGMWERLDTGNDERGVGMIDGSSARKHGTERLKSETEALVGKARAEMERLRQNILQVRALELRRQLVLGRLRQILAPCDRNTAAPDPSPAPGMVAVVVRGERDDEALNETSTLH